jgi:ABC-type nitrate/sulfonate/bicarbonate transport system substrate-binding protein
MFETKEIDCMTGWEPLMAAATVKSGGKYLVDFIRPEAMESVEYAVMSDFAEKNPDVVYRFVRALLKGTLFLDQMPEKSVEVLSTAVGFGPEIVRRALKHTIVTKPYVDMEGAKIALVEAIKGGKIASSAVNDEDAFVQNIIDHSFLDRAKKALEQEGWKP